MLGSRAVSDLVADARAGRLHPVSILHSEHPVLVDRAVAAIRDAAVPPAMRGFNYDIVEGKATAARILGAARTLPMMGPRRMVLVRDAALIPADEHPALIEYLEKPSETTVLVLLTSKLDKRLKLFSAAAKRGLIHVLEAPRNPAPWIRAEAEARKVALRPDAVERLVDAVGADLSRLALVIEQLALYAGDRAVTGEDVEDLVADTRERTVFELTDAIGLADLRGALSAVSSLTDQRQSAIGVLVMLARHIRQLSLLHAGRAQGLGKGELAQAVGVPPFIADKLAQQARRYTPGALARATRLIADADRALKGQVIEDEMRVEGISGAAAKALGRQLADRMILERLVTEIVGMAG
jgi:DNA polymerase III subunit delta